MKPDNLPSDRGVSESSLTRYCPQFIGSFLVFFLLTPYVNGNTNILLILSDDLNARLGTYGDTVVKTPNLDMLAAHGTQFERAYVQYPQCTQSRSSFLTGLYPDQTGVIDWSGLTKYFRDYVPKVETLPQVFRRNGYFTAAVGKIFHHGPSERLDGGIYDDTKAWDDNTGSWDHMISPQRIDHKPELQKNVQYLGPILEPRNREKNYQGGWLGWARLGGSPEDYVDGVTTMRALEILDRRQEKNQKKPFFLAVGYNLPHVPFAVPDEYFDMYPIEDIVIRNNPKNDREDIPFVHLADKPYELDMSEEQEKILLQGYFASISFVDNQVGHLLNKLDELGLRESTVVVFASDHGFLLGEHDLWQKPNLFEDTLRIPLIISSPNAKQKGKVSDSIVELVDIYPTILDLANIAIPSHVASRSFAGLLDAPHMTFRSSALSQSHSQAMSNKRKSAVLSRPGVQLDGMLGYSIRTERYRYTEWGGGVHGGEMYDHKEDPEEFNNIWGDKGYSDEKKQLQALLRKRIELAQERKSDLKAI